MKKKIVYLFMILSIVTVQAMPIFVYAQVGRPDQTINRVENLTKESTIYAGEIFVDGASSMSYLYSEDFSGTEVELDNLKNSLPDNFAGLVPGESSAEGGLYVSTNYGNEMNSSWTSARYVADTYFGGEKSEEISSNMYDSSQKFKSFADSQQFETIPVNKRLLSILSLQNNQGDYQMIGGVLTLVSNLNIEVEATTVIYKRVDITSSSNSTVAVHTIFKGVGGSYKAAYDTTNQQELEKQNVVKTSSGFFEVPAGNDITLIATPAEGYYFKGWFETHEVEVDGQGNMDWEVGDLVSSSSTYTYEPSVNDPYLMPVFGLESNLVSYTLTADDGNQIIMKDEEGRILVFNSTEILNLTDDQLNEIASEMGVSCDTVKEMLDDIVSRVKKSLKGKGTILKIYDFSISDGSPVSIHNAPGGFKIRLKVTDDMKDFNKFTLYYLNDEYDIEETIELTRNGDYLEGILPHLSGYVLVGNKVEDNNNNGGSKLNPSTSDGIVFYVSVLSLSVVGLIGVGIYRKKRYS